MFILGTDYAFNIREELGSSCGLQGTETGNCMFVKAKETFVALEQGVRKWQV
jgi:hypothetical protein